MKNRIREIVMLSAFLVLAGLPARAQDATGAVSADAEQATSPARNRRSWGAPEGRMFLPHNWLRGYVDASFAPPHNEPDLGRCSPSGTLIANAGGPNSPCTAYARYLLGGYLEIQPFGKTLARHVFVFLTPTFSLGSNVPQFAYTWAVNGIAFERAVGVGIELPKHFEFRVTQHQVDWLGKYTSKNLDPSVPGLDLGTSGPYGLYTTIGARWYFGGYGRER